MADIGLDDLGGRALRVQLLGRFQVLAGQAAPVQLPAGKATTPAELLVVRRGTLSRSTPSSTCCGGTRPRLLDGGSGVGHPPLRHPGRRACDRAFDRLVRALPAELRDPFTKRGRLANLASARD